MSDVTAKIVTPPPPPQPDTRRVVLEMPYDVAVTLQNMIGHHVIGGGVYREHVDLVYHALLGCGIAASLDLRFDPHYACFRLVARETDVKTTSTE